MRNAEEIKMDELYESILVMTSELGVKTQQLRIMMNKLGKPVLHDEFKQGLKPIALPTPDEIIRIVADTLTQRVEEIKGKSRYRDLVDARSISIKLIRETLADSLSLKQLGRIMGNRDHSTIIHSINDTIDLINHDEEFTNKYLKCNLALKQYIIENFNNKNQ